MSRIVCWFSCGAASAVATKLAIEKNAGKEELVVVSIYLKDEHPDSARFLKDCEKWFGQEIIIITDDRYNSSVDEVIAKTKYMSGVQGAVCTRELKKFVRKKWQRDNDLNVFGFDVNEESRVDKIIDAEPELLIWPTLIESGLSKKDCFDIIKKNGIELPEMYKLGYHNNNCVGCLKAGGAGYWNKIRKDFPEVFEKRSKQEKMLGVALTKMSIKKVAKRFPETLEAMEKEGYDHKMTNDGRIRIPLRFLHPKAGSHKDLEISSCGFTCQLDK